MTMKTKIGGKNNGSRVGSSSQSITLREEEITSYIQHLYAQEDLLPYIKAAFKASWLGSASPDAGHPMADVDPFQNISQQIAIVRKILIDGLQAGERLEKRTYPLLTLKNILEVDLVVTDMAVAAFSGKSQLEYNKKSEKSSSSSRGGKTGGKTRAEADPDGIKAFSRIQAEQLRREGVHRRNWVTSIQKRIQRHEEYGRLYPPPTRVSILAWIRKIYDNIDQKKR